jgi:hypothetical protein
LQHSYTFIIIALAIMFGVYRRIRRNIGFQPLKPSRLRVRAFIFIIIGILLLVATIAHPIAYVSDAIGIALGLLLGYFAIQNTQFEQRGQSWAYRPKGWIGGVVICLFLARLVYGFYRDFEVIGNASATAGATSPFSSSYFGGDPWTEGIIFILFAYYPCYFLFLAYKARHLDGDRLTHAR